MSDFFLTNFPFRSNKVLFSIFYFAPLQGMFEEHKLNLDVTLQDYESILADVVDKARPILADVLRESPAQAQVWI